MLNLDDYRANPKWVIGRESGRYFVKMPSELQEQFLLLNPEEQSRLLSEIRRRFPFAPLAIEIPQPVHQLTTATEFR